MTDKNTPSKSKASQPSFKQLAAWGLAGLMGGIAIGTIIGIAIYYQNFKGISGYPSDATEITSELGKPLFNAITETTANFLSFEKTSDQISAFSGFLTKSANNEKKQPITEKLEKAPQLPVIQSSIGGAPKIDIKPKVQTQPVMTAKVKYKDGYGSDDINTATAEQLDKVPRLSAAMIKDIVQFIQTKGPITSFDQLLEIKGIGEKTVEKLRQYFHIK